MMLPTQPLFRCRLYGNMPVVREWRYFVDGGKLLYGIPYWPEEALEQGGPDADDWREHLKLLQTEPSGTDVLAKKAGECIGGLLGSVSDITFPFLTMN